MHRIMEIALSRGLEMLTKRRNSRITFLRVVRLHFLVSEL